MTAAENMRKVLGQCGAYRLTEGCPLEWELAAYGAGFAMVGQALALAGQDAFAGTATTQRLDQWEANYLPGPATCGAADRRKILAARLSLFAHRGPLTLGDMPTLLLAAGIEGTAQETGGKVVITPTQYLLPQVLAQKELGLLMPLHLTWEISQPAEG